MSSNLAITKKYAVPFTIVYILAIGIWFIFRQNPSIFVLKQEVLTVISETVNALVLLIVPFIFGVIAASARVMISELNFEKNIKLIAASGLMSSFSWLGIKSKVFIALLTPYIAKNAETSEALVAEGSSEFYSMALVAVLVGAFASNLYIFVNQKVESLTSTGVARNKSSNSDAEGAGS